MKHPSSKHQHPEKHQVPSFKFRRAVVCLKFEVSLVLGCWSLVLLFLSEKFFELWLDGFCPDGVTLF